jgi:hypothetical protein
VERSAVRPPRPISSLLRRAHLARAASDSASAPLTKLDTAPFPPVEVSHPVSEPRREAARKFSGYAGSAGRVSCGSRGCGDLDSSAGSREQGRELRPLPATRIGVEAIRSGLRCEESGELQALLFPPVASIDRCAGAPRERIPPTGPILGDEPVGDISTVNAPERQHSRSSFAHDLRHSQSGTAGALHIPSLVIRLHGG